MLFKIDDVWTSFIEVKPSEGQRRVCEFLLPEIARRLNLIPRPKVKFFYRQDHHSRTLKGFCESPHEIWIADDLTDRDLCAALVHESRHAHQYSQPGWAERSPEQRERDATLFEISWERY